MGGQIGQASIWQGKQPMLLQLKEEISRIHNQPKSTPQDNWPEIPN